MDVQRKLHTNFENIIILQTIAWMYVFNIIECLYMIHVLHMIRVLYDVYIYHVYIHHVYI